MDRHLPAPEIDKIKISQYHASIMNVHYNQGPVLINWSNQEPRGL